MGNNAEKPQGNPAKKPNDQGNDQNDALRAFVLLDQSKDAGQCRIDAASQEICKLGNNRKFDKLKKIAKMANELCEKFLCKLEGIKFKQGDVMGNLKLAQTLPAWKEIAKRLEKSAKFEIKAKKGAMPAMIIFEYGNGKTENYPLELSGEQQSQLNEAIISPLKMMLAKQSLKPNTATELNIIKNTQTAPKHYPDTTSENIVNITDNLKGTKDKESIKKSKEQQNEKNIELAKRCQSLQTPKAAYEKMLNSTHYLSEDLLAELSGPTSKIAAMWANRKMEEGDKNYRLEIEKAQEILNKYYPDHAKNPKSVSKEENEDVETIAGIFGMQ